MFSNIVCQKFNSNMWTRKSFFSLLNVCFVTTHGYVTFRLMHLKRRFKFTNHSFKCDYFPIKIILGFPKYPATTAYRGMEPKIHPFLKLALRTGEWWASPSLWVLCPRIPCRSCTNIGRQFAMATKFCTVGPNICRSSVLNFLYVTVLAPRILRWVLDFWKYCVPPPYRTVPILSQTHLPEI